MIQLQFINAVLSRRDTSLLFNNDLDETFFTEYSEEYKYIKEHANEYGNVPDLVTFVTKFPNFDVLTIDEPNSYLIDALYEDKNKRYLINVFNQIATLVNNNKTEDALNLYTSAMDVAVKSKHMECVDLLSDTSRYDSFIDKMSDFGQFYVKTGFKELDDIIGGWDRHEELATIAARTNQGKSWILLKTAVAGVEQGLRVGIYSGEMSANKVGYRVDTLISHISNSGLTRGNSSIQNEYKRYLDGLKNRFSGCLKVLTPDMISGPAGVSSLRAFIERENLDMLCIDQHSLLEDDRGARNPVERASNISKDLKNLQVLKKIPIISVSQQNRASTENGVDASHIAQSDRIAQDSTIIIFFENNPPKDEDNIKDNTLTLHLVKSRDSVNMKKLSYHINLDKGEFKYISESDDREGQIALAEEFDEEVIF